MPAGRKTDYSKDMQSKADRYEKSEWEKDGRVVPSVEGLARHLEVSRSTVYLWAEKHEAFSDTLDRIKGRQAELCLNKGLDGDFNSTISKLLLTNHGYREKTETDITTKGESINRTADDALIAEYEAKLRKQIMEEKE